MLQNVNLVYNYLMAFEIASNTDINNYYVERYNEILFKYKLNFLEKLVKTLSNMSAPLKVIKLYF